MKKLISVILYLCLLLFSLPQFVEGKTSRNRKEVQPVLLDSILDNVMLFAPFYEKIVADYKAKLYIRGKMDIKKHNHLIRIVPSMFRMEKGVKEYMLEAFNDIHYTAPNIYDLKVTAMNGTLPKFPGITDEMKEYFDMNIYSSTLLYDKILSPLAANGRKHYNYSMDSVMGAGDSIRYKIRIEPKSKSYQLVKGYLIISDQIWTVRELYFEGRSEIIRFKAHVTMGEKGPEEFLPIGFDVGLTFKLLWNHIDWDYIARMDYSEVTLADIDRPVTRKNKYDLTSSFNLRCDPEVVLRDSTLFAEQRPVPLNKDEEQIYDDYAERKYSRAGERQQTEKKEKKAAKVWNKMGDILLSNYTLDFASLGSVKCSPLINPFMVSYSHRRGFSYRQKFRYYRFLKGDRLLGLQTRLGYNFKLKEFYWTINGDFDYWPEKRASLHVEVGNGNRIYSSDVLDDIKSTPDSLFNFDQLHLDYFKDLYFSVNHSIEVVNGLTVSVGFTSHRRTAVEKSKLIILAPDINFGDYQEMLAKLRNVYNSFAPHVKVEWTPGRYYYMSGKRKVNLNSKYPTFSFDWERGIRGILHSTGEYERMELDVQHHIRLGLMRTLYYRVGGGIFTNQKELYFVDFANFYNQNLPMGWNDDVSGVFQLLDGRWYNSSDQYFRGNITYEAPFLLMKHLNKLTGAVLNERLYFSILCKSHLLPYIELGYGIGTNIFDAGVFVNNINGKFKEFGFKFTFELFN